MILTEIGEVGIEFEGRAHVLRPSLYAMTKLGAPAEIVRVYASVCTEIDHRDKLGDAVAAIYACCEDDITHLYGTHCGTTTIEFAPGVANEAETIALAQRLLAHGVTGTLPAPKRESEQEYVQEFDAKGHVATAIAHLGISSRDAWQMTMTELVGALRAKFPDVQSDGVGAKAPNKEQLDDLLAWHDKVLAMKG